MKDGLVPALISDTRAGVSFAPLTIKRPGEAVGDETPCETRTRVLSPLGGLLELDEPQEIRLKLTTMRLQDTRRARFKRGLPKI
jgi:hypothetical protein